jgi:hypothetical protein
MKMFTESSKRNTELLVTLANRPPVVVESGGGGCSIF